MKELNIEQNTQGNREHKSSLFDTDYNNLLTQRNEVMSMVLSTFDKELYEKDLKENAFEEGAYQKLKSLVEKKLQKGLSSVEIADMLEENIEVIEKIIKEIENN